MRLRKAERFIFSPYDLGQGGWRGNGKLLLKGFSTSPYQTGLEFAIDVPTGIQTALHGTAGMGRKFETARNEPEEACRIGKIRCLSLLDY
jgi:hypothetical protein